MSLATPSCVQKLQTASHASLLNSEGVCLFREPDAGNLPVRFDEREQETEPSQTGLRWRGESQAKYPPGRLQLLRLFSTLQAIPNYNIETSPQAASCRGCECNRDFSTVTHSLSLPGGRTKPQSAGLLLVCRQSGSWPYCGLRFSGLPIASKKMALFPLA